MMGRWLSLLAVVGLVSVMGGCVVETDCIDDNDNGICDVDKACIDDNLNGICDDEEFCTDTDGDTVCDEDDFSDCIDDITLAYTCDACTEADNWCSDPWLLNYCVDGTWYPDNDCNVSCTTDDRVYAQTCGGIPAVAGECGDGLCVCWCEDSFDQCLDNDTIQYQREGTTYVLSCKDYCNGPCDAALGACACP